uniref:transcription initiation factor TFIID subunit 5-like isoform X2 n=1 Tax=Myxine glutinosa TaxID=7769 RepID=UPI00358F1E56
MKKPSFTLVLFYQRAFRADFTSVCPIPNAIAKVFLQVQCGDDQHCKGIRQQLSDNNMAAVQESEAVQAESEGSGVPAVVPGCNIPPTTSTATSTASSGASSGANSGASSGAATGGEADRRTLLAVLNFLQRQGLKSAEEALRREAGFAAAAVTCGSGTPGGSSEPPPDVSSVLSAYRGGGDSTQYETYYAGLQSFVESALDSHKAELQLLLFPVFCHMYLELVYNEHTQATRPFFDRFHGYQESYYSDDLRLLGSLTRRDQLERNEVLQSFRASKFVIRLSREAYVSLRRHLTETHSTHLLVILQEHLYLDVYEGLPRARPHVTAGGLTGESRREANRAKVFFGLLREPDLEIPPDEDDEDAAGASGGSVTAGGSSAASGIVGADGGGTDDSKAKKKKPKKEVVGGKGKKQDPNAPLPNRIPLPELKDGERLDKVLALRESNRRLRLGPNTPPSICFYTLLNAYQGLTACDISDDAGLLAAGFADSSMRVWSLTPRRLRHVKQAHELALVEKAADDVLERVWDDRTSSEFKLLLGHGGPVYATAFSPDRANLLSCSEDGSVRLWSLHTFSCLVAFRGHARPVWDVAFSPHGYYFVSAGCDRLARIWATDHPQPLRLLAGHLADVNVARFHPNSNYVGTGSADRTVRLWDVLNGAAVRTLTGHKGPIHSLCFSPNGKYLATGGADGLVLLWDLNHGTLIAELTGHTDTVYALRFSRDAEVLASGAADCTVRVWDVAHAFEEVESEDFPPPSLAAPPDPLTGLSLGSYATKCSPVVHLHFTRRNLLLACGAYTS